MPSFRLTLAYDGTDFAGSQIQPGERTVQGVLESAISVIAETPLRARLAGRTDRGVHATGQVAAVTLPAWRATGREMEQALNARFPADLRVVQVDDCADSFDPRFEAIWREYRYWIAPAVNSPFLDRYAWARRTALDLRMAQAGARCLRGTHDFASFAGGGEGVPWSPRATRRKGTVRTVFACDCREIRPWLGPGNYCSAAVLEFRIVADGFLPQMVRTIVGALVHVGQGRRHPDWIGELLAARDRRASPIAAPPRGLTLSRVGFAGDVLDDWMSTPHGAGAEEHRNGTADVVAETG